jgi:hypothetical protein
MWLVNWFEDKSAHIIEKNVEFSPCFKKIHWLSENIINILLKNTQIGQWKYFSKKFFKYM